MSKTIIAVKHLYKSYKSLLAVNDLSFDVQEAICFGLLGPNGAGKTTTMKMLYNKANRDKHSDTSVEVFGHDPLTNELNIKAIAGVVPQDNNLDNELNVADNLRIYARLYGIHKKVADKRIGELLEFMELSEKKKSKISELSGGMKRRLIMARALISNPRLLILDEPTTGLDPQVRHVIWDKLRKLKKQGVTIMLTTHYMEEAFQICDQIVIMDHGVKVMEGKPAKLLGDNIEEYVLEIIHKKSFNSIKSKVDKKSMRIDTSHEVTLLYSDDMGKLRKLASHLSAGDFFLRQANLEDLFLKITGRNLNESQ